MGLFSTHYDNDFDNTGGGYILIGVEEMNGIAKRPVKGLAASTILNIISSIIGTESSVRLNQQLLLMLQGIALKSVRRLKRYQHPAHISG